MKMRVCSNKYDKTIEWLLIGLLVFMPFAFGVVHAWSEQIVISMAGLIFICFLLRQLLHPGRELIWSWAYVPVVLFLFVTVFQLLPLPARLAGIISPNTLALKSELLSDLPGAGSLLKSMPLSFYPNATEHGLRLLLAVTTVFFVVFNVFRRPDQIKRLLMAIALIGGVVAVITLAHNIFGNGKIYWFISSRYSKGYSGPFVNHSNYGQFMNLSIGAALGLFMVRLREIFAGKKVTPATVFEHLDFRSSKILWSLMAVMSIGAATVFISLTRGGMISTLIAIAFTVGLFASQRSLKAHGWTMVLVALFALICVLYVGFDAVYESLASLRNFSKAEGGRLQILKDIWCVWSRFPMFGTGLGTHLAVYPMFDRSTIAALASHAENEYAQVAEETGLIGLGLLIVFGIIIWSSYAKNIRNSDPPIRLASYGLGFGILAILVHSLSDFGQHLPANTILSAIFCALLLVLAQPGRNGNSNRAAHIAAKYVNSPVLRMCVLFGACALWIWAVIGANKARIAETHWQKAVEVEKGLMDKSWCGTDAEYADLISHAAAAADRQPGNIKYRHWLNVYRWRSICRAANPDAGKIVLSAELTPAIHDIVGGFYKALAVCPTHGPTHSLVGQIEKFILNEGSGEDRIRRGFRLAPCDPVACFLAGWLDVLEGKTQDCIEKFERAARLDGSLFKDIADIYVIQLSRPCLAVDAAGDDIDRLTHVVNTLEAMSYDDLAQSAREKLRRLLEEKCREAGTPGSVYAHLGDIYVKQHNNEAAIDCYRQALSREYGQVSWRIELANLLAASERIPEALREAKICLQLRPQLKTAMELVANLSVNPAVFEKEN